MSTTPTPSPVYPDATSTGYVSSLVFDSGTMATTVPMIQSNQWQIAIPHSGNTIGIGVSNLANPAKRHLGVRLYFSFVKSRFTKLEANKIQAAVRRYSALKIDAREIGQRGLYEQLSELLLQAAREQQLLACGFSIKIERADVTKYMDKVDGKIELCSLAQFPRVIPSEPAQILAKARDRGLFDDYWVLFHPVAPAPAKPGEPAAATPTPALAKTTADKIKEKDPIIFGSFAHAPTTLYYIADWIDEHCDLTLEKLVTGLKTVEKDYGLKKVRLPTDRDVEALKNEVLRRRQILKDTNMSNWREYEEKQRREEAGGKRPVSFRKWLARMVEAVRGLANE